MDLIERYVHEVTSALPRKLRKDVSKELRSTLEETVESRQHRNPTEDPEELAVAVLKDFGPPRELASSYRQEAQYLVGPTLYPAFRTTIRICVLALVGLILLGLLTGLGSGPSPVKRLFQGLVESFDSFLTASLTLIGLVVVVFVIVERASGDSRISGRDWDPRSLPSVEDPNRISRLGMVIKIAFLMLLFYLANFESHRLIGSFLSVGDKSGWVPFLGPAFRETLGLLNLIIVLDVTLGIWVLRQGRWRPLTRWLDLGTTLLFAYLLFRLAFGPSPVEIDPEWMVRNGWSPETAAWYADLTRETLSPMLAIALKLGFLGTCIGALGQLKLLVIGNRSSRRPMQGS